MTSRFVVFIFLGSAFLSCVARNHGSALRMTAGFGFHGNGLYTAK